MGAAPFDVVTLASDPSRSLDDWGGGDPLTVLFKGEQPRSAAVSGEGWNLAELVDSLRGCREHSPLNNRSTIEPAALPSPKLFTKVLESLKAALYPRRLGPSGSERGAVALREASIDDFVGLTLHDSLLALRDQIRIELATRPRDGESRGVCQPTSKTAPLPTPAWTSNPEP
jgi:hypothetical protein